jgi:hypothetical protein
MIVTLYLDMDGVIADFDKGYSSIYNIVCRDDPKANTRWFEFVDNKGFENLEPTKDFHELMDYIFSLDVNVHILSALSARDNYNKVREQKVKWLEKHDLGHLPATFVRQKVDKSLHASPTCILIDDSSGCVNPFKGNGGYAILHESAGKTIAELEEYKRKGLLCALSLDQEI